MLLILISAWLISQDFKDMILHYSKILGEPLFIVSIIVSAIVVLTIKHYRDKTLDRLNNEISEIEELERD